MQKDPTWCGEWNWPFPVLWPLLSLPNLLAYWVQHFHSITFQDLKELNWNSTSPLAFFIVMISKAHLTSHSRMSGSRWLITPSWLSTSWRSFLYSSCVYSYHLFLKNAKECSNYRTIALISHVSKLMLKTLQARLRQYVNHELPDVQAGFRKGRGTRDQIANIPWIIEKAREFQKNI